MKSEPQQALLPAAGNQLGEVEERLVQQLDPVVNHDLALMQVDEQPTGSVAGIGEPDGPLDQLCDGVEPDGRLRLGSISGWRGLDDRSGDEAKRRHHSHGGGECFVLRHGPTPFSGPRARLG